MSASLSQIRSAILARLVCNAPDRKLGRTQLMKLFYFLQELKGVQLGYDFRLFAYGPSDSEVLSDLATATSVNVAHEKTVIFARSYGFEITPGPHAEPEVPTPAPAVPPSSVPWLALLGLLWVGSSVGWFALACRRIGRFHQALRAARPAPAPLQALARELAGRMGLTA